MKKILLSACIITAMIGTALAQGKSPKKTPEQRAKAATERMKKQCALSDEQALKVSAINFEAAKKIDEVRAKRRAGEKEGLGKQFQAIEQQRMSQFGAVLTPEQVACYKKMREEAKDKKKENKGKSKAKSGKKTEKVKKTKSETKNDDDDGIVDDLED